MTLNSALEDLRETTLKALTFRLQRLEYLSRLRDAAGTYTHWGLARIHGEIPAAKALAQEHRVLISRILATPVQSLLEDLEQCSQHVGMLPAAYLEHLSGLYLTPPDLGSAGKRHLNSVLHALSSLAKARLQGATHQAS
jgi:hypothetical protein